jgi:alanyl-tRNA synthetase
MKLSIDMDQRYAKMRAHTATHLLHAELAKIFPNTKQAGSLVDEDLLRFDFYANNLLTPDQIRDVENKVNQTIFKAFPVDLIETSFEE